MQTIKEVVILYFWSSLLPVLRWPKASHLDSNKWESHPNSAPPILTLHHRVTPATFSSLLVICSYNSEILDLQRSKGWMLGSICLSVSFTFFISVSMIITICHFRNICFVKQYFFFPYCGGVHGEQDQFYCSLVASGCFKVKSLKNSCCAVGL